MSEEDYLIPVYKKIGGVFVRGRGSFLWDEKRRRFLDLFPGWGVSILGHCHPRIVKVVREQANQLIHLPNNLRHPWQAALAKKIVDTSFKGKVFFANSGAEAVEAAIKFTRLYGKGERYEIITMKSSFHGRTLGALSATGQKEYKYPFRPLLPKFTEAKFNDFGDFERKVNKKTVGVILELIQGEGGVNVAREDYVRNLRKFCDENDLIFIVDEVQTGMGRTAKLFCFQHYSVQPDIMLLSKGLGAGFPISAMVVKEKIANLMGRGKHASTFGGAPLPTRVSWEVFKIIEEEKILANVKKMGRYFTNKLQGLKKEFAVIKEIRGKGLMIGIELATNSYPFFEEAFKKGLIINSTHKNVLRIMPALNVKKEEIDLGLNILQEVFEKLC